MRHEIARDRSRSLEIARDRSRSLEIFTVYPPWRRVCPCSNETTSGVGRCVVLKNMFDRLSDEAQSNPNYFTELADDVRQECSKMGTVIHAAADKWSNGFVYLKLLAHTEAARVKEVMHGRRARRKKCRATPRAVGADDRGVRSPQVLCEE